MKARKQVFIISLILVLISLAGSVTFHLLTLSTNNPTLGMFYDIVVNIFGGAVLGLILTLVEYLSDRRRAFENFYIEASKLYKKLRNPPCFYFNETESFIQYKYEMRDNPKIYHGVIDSEQLSQYIEYLRKIAEVDLDAFDVAYGQFAFIFRNENLQKFIYESIYEHLSQYFNGAKQLIEYMDVMDVNEYKHFELIMHKVKPICDQWYLLEVIDTKECITYNLYSKTFAIAKRLSVLYDIAYNGKFPNYKRFHIGKDEITRSECEVRYSKTIMHDVSNKD